MSKRRRRFKQTTTLAHRLAEQAGRLRDRAKQLPPGTEQTTIWRKVRQTETALRMDEWLSPPQRADSGGVTPLLEKRESKSSMKSTQNTAS